MATAPKATTATTTTKTTTKSPSRKAAQIFFYYTALIAISANLILSAEAIRCHQCNSHVDEGCADLLVNTPRAQRDEQYLKVCEVEDDVDVAAADNVGAFCRKTVIHIEVNGEKRITRSCGFIKEKSMKTMEHYCISADNEGFQQTFCTCETDGCNAAPALLSGSHKLSIFCLTAFTVIVASLY